jgi:hypothetical protein
MRRFHASRPDLMVVATVVSACGSGVLLGHLIRSFRLCCGPERPPDRLAYVVSANAELATAVILLMTGGFVGVALRCRGWVWLPLAGSAALLVLLSIGHRHHAVAAVDGGGEPDWIVPLLLPLLMPLTWPLLALAAGSAVIVAVRALPSRRTRAGGREDP